MWRVPEEEAALGNHSKQSLSVCKWPALGMPWGTVRSNTASAVCSRCGGELAGGYIRGAVQVIRGVAVVPVSGDFQRRRQHSATTAHKALPA